MKSKTVPQNGCPYDLRDIVEIRPAKNVKNTVIVVELEMKRYIDHVSEKQELIFADMAAFKEYLLRCSKISGRNFYDAKSTNYRNFRWDNDQGCIYEITKVYERKELFGSFLHKDEAGDPLLAYFCDPSIKRLMNQTGYKKEKLK